MIHDPGKHLFDAVSAITIFVIQEYTFEMLPRIGGCSDYIRQGFPIAAHNNKPQPVDPGSFNCEKQRCKHRRKQGFQATNCVSSFHQQSIAKEDSAVPPFSIESTSGPQRTIGNVEGAKDRPCIYEV